MGSPATVAQDASASDRQGQGVSILVLGDALGGGVGAGLMRVTKDDPDFSVTLRFNELSGLARPELYDWSTTIPNLVEGKSYDAIVIMVGENDRQEIHNGNLVYAFGSDNWKSAYEAQLDKVIAALKATRSAVYWVSLPPMAEPGYEAAMQQVTASQKARVVGAGLHFIDIRSAFLDANGNYTDRGPDDTGTVRTLRGHDGVSFYKAGNNRMGQLVLAAIKAGEAAPPATTSATPRGEPAPPPTVPVQPPSPPGPANPLFGEIGGDGSEITFRADAIASAIANTDGGMPLTAKQALAPLGSAAADLLVRGVAAVAPAGRADDFVLPQK
jgi:hypothetical protein